MAKGELYLIKNQSNHVIGAFSGEELTGGDRLSLFLPVFELCGLSIEKAQDHTMVVMNEPCRHLIMSALRLKEAKTEDESAIQKGMLNLLEAV